MKRFIDHSELARDSRFVRRQLALCGGVTGEAGGRAPSHH